MPRRNPTQCALGRIVAQANPSVFQELGKHVDAFEDVIHRLGDVIVARELGPFPFHPIDQVIDQRGDVIPAHGKSLIGRQSVDRPFEHENGINLPNRLEGDRRDDRRRLATRLRGDVGKLKELASCVAPTSCLRDRAWFSLRLEELVKPRIRVGLEDSAISGEMLLGMHATPVG